MQFIPIDALLNLWNMVCWDILSALSPVYCVHGVVRMTHAALTEEVEAVIWKYA